MLLRTSSNPLSQALLSSVSDGTKREIAASAAPAACSSGYKASAATTRCITSPRVGSPKLIRSKPVNTKIRRSFSDSDLEDLVCSSSWDPAAWNNNNNNLETRSVASHIQGIGSSAESTISPSSLSSLSFHHMAGELLDWTEGDERKDELDRTSTSGVTIDDIFGGGDFSPGMGSIVEEEKEGEAADEDQEDVGFPMYLAAGLGVDNVTCDFYKPNFESKDDMEKYYKSMIKEFPSHSLLLRNYADLLKDKGDLNRAKDYYHMATMADPADGEILSHYAKLVWELDGDSGKANQYFKRAIQLSSQDSHVLAAYASFLWETDQDSPKNLNEDMICGGPSTCEFSFEAAAHEKPFERMMCQEEEGMSGGGNGGSNVPASSGGFSGGGGSSLEEYYKKMVQENPSNPMILRNYARFLYQDKGDLNQAKDYYHMATMADPGDGEILSQYAKVVWELDGDSGKSDEYFKKAIQLSSQDSQVLAAYASFLWGTDQDGPKNSNEKMSSGEPSCGFSFEAATHAKPVEIRMICREEKGMSGGGNGGSNVSASSDGFGGGGGSSLEEYYKRMVQDNPSNPMILKNYARFLYQSKGDLEGAEEYYGRAILLDGSDGELLTQYAKLLWEVHEDKQKAHSYFHRAAQVAPGNNTVLAAYASFLWSADDDDEECNNDTDIQLPSCVHIPVSQGVFAAPTT